MPDETLVLILTPVGRDAQIASAIIASLGIKTQIFQNLDEVLPHLDSAYCFVVSEEALVHADRKQLAEWVERQPAWSDLPIILLTLSGAEFDERLAFLDRHLIVMERPFLASSFTNSVRSAIRSRARQLEVKSFIEQRQQVADRQKLLIRELHHRVKNTLANVRAMMSATARSSGNIEDFMKDFSARILSLAETHSLLTDDYWQTASIRQMLQGELRHYEMAQKPRISLNGPDVPLVSDIAIPVGMAFHELASNSSKFGSLSQPEGQLDVSWKIESDGGQKHVVFDWRERKGPKVEPPRRKGFGTTLLEKVVAVQCEAKVALSYDPDGLHFTMILPLRDTRLVPSYT